ncbi:MAG: sortase, partial [Oscillospiraceae bacterium]|nr:sortase [Oscillospiraceae bacterium]
MRKLLTLLLAIVLTAATTIPAFAAYEFGSGSDTLNGFGGATSYDEPVVPDPMSANIRRNKDAAALPPPYGVFSGNIPTEPSSPYHDNLPESGFVHQDQDLPPNGGEDYVPGINSVTLLPSTSQLSEVNTVPLYYEDGSIGTLYVEKINKTIKVYEGESLDNLKIGAGHFSATSAWDGNCALAGHNRGGAAYFSFVKDLALGDRVTYTTQYGTRTYEVFSKEQISEYDNSKLGWSAENILNQTLRDIQWVVLDNGCTDGTGTILERYAAQDSRVVLLKNKMNSVDEPNSELLSYRGYDVWDNIDGEYFTTLDSDDTYDLTFAETIYNYAKKYDADMAVCGTMQVAENNPTQKSPSVPPLFIGKNPSAIADNWSKFYPCVSQVWAKLFRTSKYREYTGFLTAKPYYLSNGNDTYFCFRYMQIANRIVCFDKPLHTYLIRVSGAFQSRANPNRSRGYDLVIREGMKLFQHWKKLSSQNLSILYGCHLTCVKNCISIAGRADKSSAQERFALLQNTTSSPLLAEYYSKLPYNLRDMIYQGIADSTVNITKSIPHQERFGYYNLYSYRLFGLLNIDSRELAIRDYLLYFSSIFDPDNISGIGIHKGERYVMGLLPNCEKPPAVLLADKNTFLETVNSDSAETQEFKQSLFDAMDSGDLETVLSGLSNLGLSLLYDRDVLYLRAYLSNLAQDYDGAMISIIAANVFYPSDSALLELSDEIYHSVGIEPDNSLKVAVIGLGFVGLTTALGFAEKGYEVYGYDINENRTETISCGKLPFLEPGLDDA